MLVREDTEVRIPSLIDQKVSDLTGSVQVDFVLRRIEQDHERTGDITSDLRGDGFVFLYFGAVVAGHSTVGALDAGVEEPLSGARRRVSSKQANSLTPPIKVLMKYLCHAVPELPDPWRARQPDGGTFTPES